MEMACGRDGEKKGGRDEQNDSCRKLKKKERRIISQKMAWIMSNPADS